MAGQSEAQRIIDVMKGIVDNTTKSGANIEVTYGQVAAVTGREASVYLAGARELTISDGGTPEASEDYRIPSHLTVAANDYVRVSIDARGHRWIEEVFPSTSYPKISIDVERGRINFGTGATAPSNYLIWDSADASIRTDGAMHASKFVAGDDLYGFMAEIPALGGTVAFASKYTGGSDTFNRMEIDSSGRITWGPGNTAGDTNLYRESANILRTDDMMSAASLWTGGDAYVGGKVTVAKNGGTTSLIEFPAQTNDPGYIKHIENINAAEMQFSVSDDIGADYFTFGAAPSGTWQERLAIASTGALYFSGAAKERDTNLYREAAAVLKTDAHFTAGGTLSAAKFANGIQSGWVDVTASAAIDGTATVTFSPTFATTPNVVVSGTNQVTRAVVAKVQNATITTSGFTVIVSNTGGASWTGTVRVYWIAVAS